MKLVVKRKEDPKKLTPQELEAQNKFAREWGVRNGLISGENTHVGEEGAPFIDASTGKQSVSSLPYGTITDIGKVPFYVKNLELDSKSNLPYYVDEKSGDIQYVHPDIARSSRFNPNRGKYDLAGRLTPNNLISLR